MFNFRDVSGIATGVGYPVFQGMMFSFFGDLFYTFVGSPVRFAQAGSKLASSQPSTPPCVPPVTEPSPKDPERNEPLKNPKK